MARVPRQAKEQATRHAAHIERAKAGYVRKFNPFLRKMERDITAQLSGDITEWTRGRLNKQLEAVRRVMKSTFDEYGQAWRGMVRELAEYEAEFETRSLGKVADYDFDVPSKSQIEQAVFVNPVQVAGADGGALLDDMYAAWSNREVRRVSNLVRYGFAQGRTTQQIIRDIRGTAPRKYVDGALAVTRRDMETFVRTALQHAAVQAREQTWRKNSDIVKKVEWVSTLDTKTSVQCRSLDGEQFPIDKGPRPPAHMRCRSSIVAALDERFKILDEGGTRSARDPETGQVESAPATETYYGWLKRQPAEVQDSIIGKARGKLLRDGGISADRFAELQLDKRFEPLTLDEMRELEPVAFKRAGI